MSSCFKAYDIRGRVPDQLNVDIAYRIGCAYATVVQPKGPVVVGQDVRESSPSISSAVVRGLNDSGVETRDIGICGTEMVYFGAALSGMGGGIMVTASHNPIDHNGMKLVRERAIPLSGDSGLKEIEDRTRTGPFNHIGPSAKSQPMDITAAYVEAILEIADLGKLRPLRIVANAGNGCAGPVFDRLVAGLPIEVHRIFHEPDGTFPNGIPNPLLPENRAATSDAVVEQGADFGIAWDGDFDRCFLFDERGRFIEGYYLVGLLAQRLLEQNPGSRIIHDPRLTWNTIAMVQAAGGHAIQSKTGHAFMKERMRKEDAVYGGEMSAHHYFKDFAYCDSGMLPWLLVAGLISETGRPLSELVADCERQFPCSGEINFRVEDAARCIAEVLAFYQPDDKQVDRTDGISVEFEQWRFNLRGSNTEPLLRLNVETRGDQDALARYTDELSGLIGARA